MILEMSVIDLPPAQVGMNLFKRQQKYDFDTIWLDLILIVEYFTASTEETNSC